MGENPQSETGSKDAQLPYGTSIEQYADLVSRIEEVTAASEQASDALKSMEKRLADMALLIKREPKRDKGVERE